MFAPPTLLAEMAAVWRLVVHLCAAEDAEAVVQEIYMRAFDALDRVPADCRHDARQWLFRIACGLLRGRTPDPSRHTNRPTRPPDPNDPVDQQLQASICELPMEERMVFLLSAVERFRYDEISLILQTPMAEVVAKLDAARKRLRPPPTGGPSSS